MRYSKFIEETIQTYLVERFGDMPTVKEMREKCVISLYQGSSRQAFSWDGVQVLEFDIKYDEEVLSMKMSYKVMT